MEGFRTLTKNSKDFKEHITGSFSAEYLAIPLPSLDLSFENDQVTFELRKRESIGFSKKAKAYARLMRFELLPLTLSPLLVIWAQFAMGQIEDLAVMFFALLFVQCGAFILHDYYDYISGVDRIKENGGTRVLNSGIIIARDAQKFAFALVGIGILCALPWMIENPLLMTIGMLGGLAGLFGYAKLRMGFILFLVFGPLLVAGIALSFGINFDQLYSKEYVLYSLFFGLGAVLYIHARQLTSVMDDHRAKVLTLATKFGFDRTKILLVSEALLIGALGIFLVTNIYVGLICLLASAGVALKISQITGPAAKGLQKLQSGILILLTELGLFMILDAGLGL